MIFNLYICSVAAAAAATSYPFSFDAPKVPPQDLSPFEITAPIQRFFFSKISKSCFPPSPRNSSSQEVTKANAIWSPCDWGEEILFASLLSNVENDGGDLKGDANLFPSFSLFQPSLKTGDLRGD